MNKVQYFVYTRIKDVDYRSIYSPDENFCPKETKKKFLLRIRDLINIESYDDSLETPRWLYMRSNGLVLFGVGVMNEELGDLYNDFCNRPVRGFFGIVMKSESPVIPMDINFFKCLYKKHIEPIWECDREHLPNPALDVDIDITEEFKLIRPQDAAISLNYQKDKCVILGDVNLEETIAKALMTSKDTSVAYGFSSKNHAYAIEKKTKAQKKEVIALDKKTNEQKKNANVQKKDANAIETDDSCFMFMNVIVKGVSQREEKIIPRPEPKKPDVPKKAVSPKLMITILVLAIMIILILFYCRGFQKD